MSGREYLEALARKYLHEGMVNEKVGNKLEAARSYRKAAEILIRMINSYRGDPMSDVYRSVAEAYLKRAQELERGLEEGKVSLAVGSGPAEEDAAVEDWVKELVVFERPGVKFEDVIGLEEAKQAVMDSIIYPTKRPDLFPYGWPRGILLYGPPGCGKTLLAAAMASEIDATFLHVDPTHIMSKWLGEGEKRVAALFRYARRLGESKPVIIFIDEVDSIFGVYEHEVGGEARVRTQFLKELDGLADKGDRRLFIYVIAATNKPWRLDVGFLRRFQKRIYVSPPNREARKQLFEYYTRRLRLSDDVNFDVLAERTEGYSASDIRDVVVEAYLRTVRELFNSNRLEGDPRPVGMRDFLEVLSRRRPSISPQLLKQYEEWAAAFGAP